MIDVSIFKRTAEIPGLWKRNCPGPSGSNTVPEYNPTGPFLPGILSDPVLDPRPSAVTRLPLRLVLTLTRTSAWWNPHCVHFLNEKINSTEAPERNT